MPKKTSQLFKKGGDAQVWVNACGYKQALMLAESGVDVILAGGIRVQCDDLKNGDILPMEVHSYHTKLVRKAAPNLPIVVSLSGITEVSATELLKKAQVLVECGASAICISGGRDILSSLSKLTDNGIPVVSHIGFDLDTIKNWRINGRDERILQKVIEDSILLASRGVQALILECIPRDIAQTITSQIKIPTIGIGAGIHCDGQLMLFDDLIGLSEPDLEAKHIKRYSNVRQVIKQSVNQFCSEVKDRRFPNDRSSFS